MPLASGFSLAAWNRQARAKSLRKQAGGAVVIADGPYLETKEHVGGFCILEAADMEEALARGRKAVAPAAYRSKCARSSKSG